MEKKYFLSFRKFVISGFDIYGRIFPFVYVKIIDIDSIASQKIEEFNNKEI